MQVLVLPWRYGQKKYGVEKGAVAMLDMLLYKNKNFNYKILFPENDNNYDYHHKIYQEKSKIKSNCLVLGGDHSISIGSVMESINNHKNVGVLWIDAHPDINTIESSKTKNFHGMPLSFITGLEKSWDWINPMKKLSFDNLHYWGIRDIDEFENNIIERSNIINHLEAAKNMISNYDYIHLSLDIDGIDPKYTPSTGTPVSKGLELYDVNSIIEYLVNSNKDYTIDIVEYNPEIGSNYDKLKTNQNVNSIIGSLTMI